MVTKVRRTAEELLSLIKTELSGRYADVPIAIKRSGSTWIAELQVDSEMTRERIQSAVTRVRQYNDLAE